MAIVYFAYGSNLCTGRLRARTPSADPIATAELPAHTLKWHKRSTDGSAKANALDTGRDRDVVWGVLFKIAGAEKSDLDRAEGLGHGYDEVEVVVRQAGVGDCPAIAYVADPAYVDDSWRPYTWYKQLVVRGALHHGLPPDYVAAIEAVLAQDDPDADRTAENLAIVC